MRVLPVMIALVASCVAAGVGDAQTPGYWFVEASAAHAFGKQLPEGDVRHQAGSGAALNATLGRQAQPWLALVANFEMLRAQELSPGIQIPEEDLTIDDARHALVMMGVRIGPPVHFGLAPSLELGTGLGWLHWGDRHVTSTFGLPAMTVAGDHDVAWGWSAGLHLRLATSRRMLTPLVAVRAATFDERGHPVRFATLGLGLRY